MQELHKIKARIEFFSRNKVNAFSPTISPAPKSVARHEVESLYEGLKYFIDKGQTELLVQPKYMGSYCDIYLAKELEDSYFVSRNGYLITHIDLEAAKLSLQPIHQKLDWNNVSLYIIQSELLPWHVLGAGLIDHEFLGYYDAHHAFCTHLQHSALYQRLEKVRQAEKYQVFLADQRDMTSKTFRAKYPSHIVRQYTALEQFVQKDLVEYATALHVYKEQVDHYGKEGALHFKPFNILKVIFEGGTERIVNDNLSYKEVNNDEFLHLHIANPEDLEAQYPAVEQWYQQQVAQMTEGVVIKPRKAFIEGLPPGLKVRNPDYLVMIYGLAFRSNLDYYIHKRKIDAKLKCSVNDWAINRQMLEVPYHKLGAENYWMKNLVFDRIMGEELESQLDSRL